MREEPVKEYTMGDEVLKIFVDEHAENPREWENLAVMVCWHRRYNLGDKHYFKDPDDFKKKVKEKDNIILPLYLYDHSGITISTSPFGCQWDSGQVGFIYCSKKRFLKETGYTKDELFNTDKHRMPVTGERVRLKGHDDKSHDGFGKVLFVTDDAIVVDFDYNKTPSFRKEGQVITAKLADVEEVLANKAVQMLQAEVKVYDYYLTNAVYGYVIEKDGDETDSCWGFYGDNFKENGILDNIDQEWAAVI